MKKQNYSDSGSDINPIPNHKRLEPKTISNKFYPEVTNESLIADSVRRVERRRRESVPVPVSQLEVSLRPMTRYGITLLALDIWFNDQSDNLFGGAKIWIKGYGMENLLGNPDPTLGKQDTAPFQQFARVSKSPATVLLFPTDEVVVVGVESINSEGLGSGLERMPTTAITLTP